MTVELPLWFVIMFAALFALITIHFMFSDLIAKILYKKFKEEEKEKCQE